MAAVDWGPPSLLAVIILLLKLLAWMLDSGPLWRTFLPLEANKIADHLAVIARAAAQRGCSATERPVLPSHP